MQYLSPYPGNKKKGIFEQREEELRHALTTNTTPAKIQRAAERLRSAKLQLLKAFRNSLSPLSTKDPLPLNRLKNLDTEAAHWLAKSADAIVEEYRPKNTDSATSSIQEQK